MEDDCFLGRFRSVAAPAAPSTSAAGDVAVSSAAPCLPKAGYGAVRGRTAAQRVQLASRMVSVKAVDQHLQQLASRLGETSRVGIRFKAGTKYDRSGHPVAPTIRIVDKTNSGGKFLPNPPGTTMKIAYGRGNLAKVAAEFHCSPTSVASARRAIAASHMRLQKLAFGALSESFSRVRGKMRMAFASLKFDETKERCVVSVGSKLKTSQQVKDWHVLVAKRRLVLAVCAEGGATKFLKVDIAVPLAPLQNTSANCLWEGLFTTRTSRPLESTVREFLDTADVPVTIIESDGAYSNNKLVWHYMNKLPPHFVKTFRLRGNHAVHLVEVSMFAGSKDLRMLGNIYDVSKVVRMNGTFLRMLAQVPSVVRAAVPSHAALGSHSFNDEVARLAVDNMEFGRRTEEESAALDLDPDRARKAELRRQRAVEQTISMWSDLKKLLPGNWAGDMYISNTAEQSQVWHLLRALVFPRIPAVPSAGKWAKGWQSLFFTTVGLCVHRLFLVCLFAVGVAGQHMAAAARPEGGLDDLEEIDWRAMHAKRYKRVSEFLSDDFNLQERERFEQEASATKAIADGNRASRSATSSASLALVAAPRPEEQEAIVELSSAVVDDGRRLHVGELVGADFYSGGLAADASPARGCSVSPFPVSEARFLALQRDEGLTQGALEREWKQQHNEAVFEKSYVPKVVKRGSMCGSICGNDEGLRSERSLSASFQKEMVRYVGKFGAASAVAKDDIVLVFIRATSSQRSFVFAALSEALSKSGPNPAEQTFTMLELCAGSAPDRGWVGLTLRVVSEPYTEMDKYIRQFDGDWGALQHMILDDLAAKLVMKQGGQHTNSITAHRLFFRMITGEVWEVIEASEAIFTVTQESPEPMPLPLPGISDPDEDSMFLPALAAMAPPEPTEDGEDDELGDQLAAELERIIDENCPEYKLLMESLGEDVAPDEVGDEADIEDDDGEEEGALVPAPQAAGEVVGAALPAEVLGQPF